MADHSLIRGADGRVWTIEKTATPLADDRVADAVIAYPYLGRWVRDGDRTAAPALRRLNAAWAGERSPEVVRLERARVASGAERAALPDTQALWRTEQKRRNRHTDARLQRLGYL